MPRYRKLHTKTVESLDINDMPDDFTRLFWVLLPLALCREGRGLDNARWIQSKLFPLRRDVTIGMVEGAFDWFVGHGMIRRYEVDDRQYFYVPTFHKYQGNTQKEAESEYPPPPEVASPELVQSKSGVSQESVKPNQPQIHTASAFESEYASESESDAEQGESNDASNALDAFVKVRGGAVNPLDVDQIHDLVDEYEAHRQTLPRASPGAAVPGDAWVRAAILEANASRQDGRAVHLNYIRAILDRWRTQGYRAKFRANGEAVQENGRTVLVVS